jgi:hypothetical protein
MFAIVLQLIANYLIVQVSILLFMAPFIAVYWWRHRPEPGQTINFNRRLENFFGSKYANWLVFSWAMGEALVWFVVPEFLLLLVVFMRISRKRQLLFYDIYGTVAGTLVAMYLHLSDKAIAALPYIQEAMITQTREWFEQLGIWGLIYQPFSGVPYKVFTHLAADYAFFIPAFLIFAVLVRISRYFIAYITFVMIFPALHRYVYRNYIPLFLIATAIFSALLFKVYMSYGG